MARCPLVPMPPEPYGKVEVFDSFIKSPKLFIVLSFLTTNSNGSDPRYLTNMKSFNGS